MVVTALSACGGSAPVRYVSPVPSSSQLHYGEDPVFTERMEQVVKEPAGLRVIWDRIEESGAAAAPLPTQINYDRRMVVMVGAGQRRAGDQIRVDSVSVQDERFSVFYSLVQDCVEGAPTVYPLQVVEVTREDYPASFVRTLVTKPGCDAGGATQ